MPTDQPASTAQLIPFDKAEVRPGIVNDTFFLSVSGNAPCSNMEVRLDPHVYIDCPEYWEIEVTGELNGARCMQAITPYNLTIPLAGMTGRMGIELIGENKTERINVSGGCS